MSEPSTAHASLSASGYADGLGKRTLEFDRESGCMLERLHVRAEFGAFESALRRRMDALASFDDGRFARVRGVERDPRGALTVLSTYVAGDRLCDLLEAATNLPAHEATSPSVDAALGFLLELLPALHAFHSATGLPHGAVAPGRITVTAAGEVVLLDTLFGQAIERLQFNRQRLWTEFGLAMPASAGALRFDPAADVSQACLAAMTIVLGRPLRENDYPDALPDLITEVIEIAQIRGSSRFASDLHKFLHRALPLPARRAHANAEEAVVDVRQVAREIGAQRCRAALTAFVGDMNRVMSDVRAFGYGDAPDVEVLHVREPAPTAEERVVLDTAAYVPVVEDVAIPEPVTDRAPVVEDVVVPEPLTDPAPARFEETVDPDVVVASVVDPNAAVPSDTSAEPAPDVRLAPEAEPPAAPSPVPEALPVPALAAPATAPSVTPAVIEAVETKSSPIEPIVAPAAVAAAPFESPTPAPPPTPAESKRARRNARRHRDKLRSHATPPPAPAPALAPAAAAAPPPPRPPLIPPTPAFAAVMPLPSVPAPAPPPRKIAQPLRDEAPLADPVMPIAPVAPIRIDPPAAAPLPVAPVAFKNEVTFKTEPVLFKPEPAHQKSEPLAFKSEPLAFKKDPHAGFSSAPVRHERRDAPQFGGGPYFDRVEPEQKRSFPWRLVAAALLVVGIGVGAGRKYLPASEPAQAAPIPSKEVVAAAKAAEAAEKSGTMVLTTEPSGARVLLDGREMGNTPLTLENVPAGKHALTFVTASASVKRIVRVETGKTAALDVAVFSGWIAVYSPIPLDISENGRAIGSSEQGRLMLSPGRHQLTLSNTELGYSSVQTVDIEPGEEHPVSVQPTGELSANAVPWAEVWMNGKKIGETPVAGLAVPLGTHEIVFKNPQFPDRRVSVTVTASAPVTASVDFSK